MFSSLVIVFREMLEMALVLGVLLAVTRQLADARRWIWLGAAAGIGGATLVAWLMEALEAAAEGNGEFIFNAVVLAFAALMITWTVIWMGRHGREVAARMKRIGHAVACGDLPRTALLIAAFAAVMREGAEAVFFLVGAAQTGQDDAYTMLAGGLLGAVLAVGAGFGLYRGLLRIQPRYLFTVTGWLLLLLAAGMTSQAAWNLVAIDLLPPLMDVVWDTSAWLPQSSLLGEFLHVLIGYDDQPSGMQVLVFTVALVLMVASFKYSQRYAGQVPHPSASTS